MNPTNRTSHPSRRVKTILRAAAIGAVSLAIGCAMSCSSSDTGSSGTASTYEAYSLNTDYATSVAVTNAALSDSWGPTVVTFARIAADAGPKLEDAGMKKSDASVATPAQGPAKVILTVARGDVSVCPGHVTVTPIMTATPCDENGQSGDTQTGTTVVFDDCVLKGGGRLDGTISVTSTHRASDTACDSNTTISITFAANVQNLAYTAPDGTATAIRNLVVDGSYDHTIGSPPKSITTAMHGSVENESSNGGLALLTTFSGQATFTLPGTPGAYSVTSSLDWTSSTARDGGVDGGPNSVRVNADGLTHDGQCCHATGGTVTVAGARTGTFTFGPACGEATANGKPVMLSDCT